MVVGGLWTTYIHINPCTLHCNFTKLPPVIYSDKCQFVWLCVSLCLSVSPPPPKKKSRDREKLP